MFWDLVVKVTWDDKEELWLDIVVKLCLEVFRKEKNTWGSVPNRIS